ncbi:PAS domain S-box-containing protein [Lutimaribacter pacificus]|uniref:histidine kinase n=1 Tax=Lutimaribacter pacificus TaxID=391948 RepID=A0A1H0G4W6_9RHOB|nr:PAS domain-containing hybrid sensor histidine kinase/response regulator [Lutimaribacter pacificus]SDO01884.1 PAS domain S-box-containing protein [Lutimaribacter pacificus]SHJ84973.1 PAS/PAC sensor hybrid histidine kinase [Lutimaribacter pacificus]
MRQRTGKTMFKKQIELEPTENRQRTKHLAVVVGLAFAIIAAIGLSMDVDRRLEMLDTQVGETDALWNASRAELDLTVLADASGMPATSADDLRARMAGFRDGLTALESEIADRMLQEDARFGPAMEQLSAFSDELADSAARSDAELAAGLPAISAQARSLLPVMSELSNNAHEVFSQRAAFEREAMAATLYRMAATAVSLVLILSIFAMVLMRLSRRAQEQAAQQRDTATRLQRIFETSLDAVLVFDSLGRISAFNGAAENMFGYGADEALGAAIADLVVPDHRKPAFYRELHAYADTGKSGIVGAGRLEMEARRKSGTLFPVELSVDRVADRDGPVFVAFVRDITDRREAEASLVEARDKALAGERAKAEFLAVMSHEMRTPLNGLLGTLSLLRDTRLDAQQKTYVHNMSASGQLLMHHVNDVLEISKFEAGKVLIANTAFRPEPLLHEMIEGQRSVAEANRNELNYEWLSDPVPAMTGDPVRLRQVLLNLISNAIKFTRNGSVSLECEVMEHNGAETLEFRVVDTGIGIAEKDIGRIFGDFETLDSTYGRRAEGTGLGLGISRRLTEAMGGEIGVDSIEGEGSIFWIRLPLERAEIHESDENTAACTRFDRALDVLIVEDNQINRVVLRDMLLAEGHNVTEAMNGEEGVRISELRRFDIILMDISMPVMDGVQATHAIRAGNGPSAETPILAVTAHALPDEIRAFGAAGMNDTVGKPIERIDLLAKLASYCGTRPPESPLALTDPEPRKPAETGAVDDQRLRELMQDLGADAAGQLLDRFIRETDATLEEIEGCSAQPMGDLVPRLHKIAGSAAVLGAATLHSRLGDLEALGKSGEEAPFREGLAELAPIWARTRAEMVDVVGGA